MTPQNFKVFPTQNNPNYPMATCEWVGRPRVASPPAGGHIHRVTGSYPEEGGWVAGWPGGRMAGWPDGRVVPKQEALFISQPQVAGHPAIRPHSFPPAAVCSMLLALQPAGMCLPTSKRLESQIQIPAEGVGRYRVGSVDFCKECKFDGNLREYSSPVFTS